MSTGAPAVRGRLRVYLGAAPGSGKTFAMLREGRERMAAGEDVVIGFVETYGRPRTVQATGRLEVVPRLEVPYRGTVLAEMDLDGVLERRPHAVLVDELAHTNAPGVRHAKRWEDVEALRDAGIDVVTTLNVQHIESVKDLVEHITGIAVRETLPDRVIDRADEIHFIDIAPEALRKRMRHGNVYAAEKVETALGNFFRPGNLAALREIALRMVAQRSGDGRGEVRPPPQDVLVAISGSDSSEALIRRGVRIARRFGGLCTAVTVVRSAEGSQQAVSRARAVADLLQCSLIVRESADVARELVRVARDLDSRHLVLGESPNERSLWRRLRPALLDRLVDELPGVDIHVIARFAVAQRRRPASPRVAQRRRPEDLLRDAAPPRRGALRVYVGYARGCGTTTAMLEEARRRRERGTDVVVAAATTSGRSECEGALAGLELLGGRGEPPPDRLDVPAVLRRSPDVVCIDDLAGPDIDGHTRAEVVSRLVDAGITVLATLHLGDVCSTVRALGGPGNGGRPLVDDSVLDLADEVELVDVVPSVLDHRLRGGDIVPPGEVEAALRGEFRPELLSRLRTMAFRLIAQHTDRRLVAYMHERSIERPWEARARVMVCIPPRPRLEKLIRRAASLAGSLDGELRVVTVRTRQRSEAEKAQLDAYAALAAELGGEFVTLHDSEAAPALAGYAKQILATEILLSRGRDQHGHWSKGTVHKLVRMLSDVDIHILARRRSDERPVAIRGTATQPRRLPPAGG
ncbi:MAG: two-component system, OmpR family, sensor histidine kinase KdpD [Chloroflexota bacterium]|nr:two-component system, OmpR family, sensor histidine kinase KdpD [Chloroflexota bacterium]